MSTDEPLDDSSTTKRKGRQLARQVDVADVQWLMANPQGRRFVRRLIAEAGVFSSSFMGNAEQTFFREGKRAVGLFVLAEVQSITPAAYIEMLTETKAQT